MNPLSSPCKSFIYFKKNHLGKAFAFIALFAFGNAASAVTYTVNTTNDTVGVSGQFSLRDAIIAVNAGSCLGDNIVFNLPATNANVGGVNYYQIKINYHDPVYLSGTVATPLPTINCPLNIDGFTQPGTTPGAPRIELDGNDISATFAATNPSSTPIVNQRWPAGLTFLGRHWYTGVKFANNPDGSTVRGLLINKFPQHGIYLFGTDKVTIIGNYFGLDVTGERAGYANGRLGGSSVVFLESSSYNYIGTTKADYEADIIAANGVNRNYFGSTGNSGSQMLALAELNVVPVSYGLCVDTTTTLPPPAGPGTTCRHPELGSHDNVMQGNYFGLNKEGNCAIGGNTLAGVLGDPGNCNPDGSRSAGPNPSAVYSVKGGGAIVISGNPTNFDVTSGAHRHNIIGGLAPGQGNVVAACRQAGIDIREPENKILGNIVGLNADGTNNVTNITPIGRAPLWISTSAFGNLIQGNILANSDNAFADGGGILVTTIGTPTVGLSNDLAPTIARKNIIGTNAAGATNIGNKGGGVKALWNMPLLLTDNVIAYNGNLATGGALGFPGIVLRPFVLGTTILTPMRVSIMDNQIYCNGLVDPTDPQCGRGLGIDLNPTTFASGVGAGNGPSLNDQLDSDTGPNALQNFPVLNADRTIYNPALVIVRGLFNSEPNKNYHLQFFSNRDDAIRCLDLSVVPPTGYVPNCPVVGSTSFLASQGEVLIGETDVTTDSSGNASFNTVSKLGVPVGSIITGTATRLQAPSDATVNYPAGAPLFTSEFSQAISVDPKGSPTAYIHANGAAGGDNGQGGGEDPCLDPNACNL